MSIQSRTRSLCVHYVRDAHKLSAVSAALVEATMTLIWPLVPCRSTFAVLCISLVVINTTFSGALSKQAAPHPASAVPAAH